MAERRMALSITFLVIGPGVSRVLDMGTIPPRLNKPTVGFSPTKELLLEGERIDPEVSVPIAAAA